jgi:amidase
MGMAETFAPAPCLPRPDGMVRSGAFLPGPLCVCEPTGRGALDDLRVAVKDLIDVQGTVTGGGNPDWARSHGPAAADASAVAALRAAGASVWGKTLTDELAYSLEGQNAHYGTPRNPAAPGHMPGGSSSGSAAAVAAGLVDAALGTDTGGSVRVPAAFCGIFGMRPTHGRVPLEGVLPFAPSLDTVGWFARDAAMLRRVGRVLLGASERDGPGQDAPPPFTRLRIATDAFALADPDVAAALREAAGRLDAVSPEITLLDSPPADWLAAYDTLQNAEIRDSLGPWIQATRPAFGPAIAPRFARLWSLRDEDIVRWSAWCATQAARLRALFTPGDCWLLPTSPMPALPLDADGALRSRFYTQALALGAIAGLAGLPQLSMPVATLDGLPLGLSLVGPPGSDEALLDLARTLCPTP